LSPRRIAVLALLDAPPVPRDELRALLTRKAPWEQR
jgi:uncharacterized protein (DUF1778 family)